MVITLREDTMQDFKLMRQDMLNSLWKLWREEKEFRWRKYLLRLMENINIDNRDVNDVIIDLQNQILYTAHLMERK